MDGWAADPAAHLRPNAQPTWVTTQGVPLVGTIRFEIRRLRQASPRGPANYPPASHPQLLSGPRPIWMPILLSMRRVAGPTPQWLPQGILSTPPRCHTPHGIAHPGPPYYAAKASRGRASSQAWELAGRGQSPWTQVNELFWLQVEQGFSSAEVAACGPGWLWESTGPGKEAKRSGQSWTNDPSKNLPPGSTEVHKPPRRPWVLAPWPPTMPMAILHHHLQRLWFQSGDVASAPDGSKGQPRSRAVGVDNTTSILLPVTLGLPRLCPLSHAPAAPVSRGEPLPKPQRKYLRPFWATGSLRQPAFFTLKAAQNQ